MPNPYTCFQGLLCRRTKLPTLRSRVVEGRLEAQSFPAFQMQTSLAAQVLVERPQKPWPNPLRAAARPSETTKFGTAV